ncbi:hypothetical protein D5S17_29045 [Pseudonocardiaceae bacterium YIM PH 21723]|nr:hypothetical protein D5S17_29045 [Pseudonocardiaceae bacterium YIM PH 21723]
MTTEAPNAADLVDDHWGRNYSPEHLRSAAAAVAALLQYAGDATGDAPEESLAHVPDTRRLTNSLKTAGEQFGQLLEQLAARVEQFSGDSTVYHDGGGDPADTATKAAGLLAQASRDAESMTSHLNEAYGLLFSLGHNTPNSTDLQGTGR